MWCFHYLFYIFLRDTITPENSEWLLAVLYVVVSVLGGLACTWMGIRLARGASHDFGRNWWIFGALSRFYLGKLLAHPYPWATFIINITGSFALGFICPPS